MYIQYVVHVPVMQGAFCALVFQIESLSYQEAAAGNLAFVVKFM